MNILELDSYNLADAVKFNTELNPRIWQGQKMRPKVREKLLQIAADFKQSLGLSDLEVKDITVSGSNAGYTYTPNSDIDLHLVVDIPQADSSDVYRELFDAKKFQYNETHNITIGGYDVELYVENANQPPVSQGMYSVVKDDWINIPLKKRSTVNDNAVKSKYDVMKHRIESAIAAGTAKRLNNTASKIKKMRQAGLDAHGELGPENLAYKMLRTQGVLNKLYAARTAAKDKQLSLKEQPKTPVVKYGFRTEDVTMTPDGVSPSTKMFLEGDSDTTDIVHEFIAAAAEELGITDMPEIQLHTDSEWSEREHSFGRYTPELHTLEVSLADRHVMDILRTTAHELVHCRQNQEHTLPDEAGETGSKWENQAHAIAGVLMRHFAESHPDMFSSSQVAEASGYIPTKKQKNDPRFSMALTVDIHPGQTGKEANKMALKTDAQGRPALLMKTANLREGRMPQPSQGPGKYRDLNEPLGPETPPTMPAGTVRIDVSDMYDWYKIGQHISNMKGLGKHDFGAGPPSSIISFGDEETEHKFIKDLKATGLDVTDIDPADPTQPASMRKIKTDPTYNVSEAFDQPYPIKWEKSEYGDYDALATLDDGTYLSISFEHVSPYEVAVSFWRNNSQEVTGEGDAQRVFATVLAAVQQFLKQEQPANISFSAVKEDDPSGSRSKLYSKLVQRYAANWGYQARSFEHDDKVEFELTKIRQNVDEDELVESLRQEFALLEDEFLGEIKMTGKNLSQLAKNIKDVKVGLEFEMIVPNVSGDDDDDEQEPDYDQDERVRDIDDAINFFDDGDYNYGPTLINVREEMESGYQEWVMEKIDSDWYDNNGLEFFQEYLEREDPFDAEEAEEEARNELQAQYGNDISTEDFEKMLFALVDEKRQAYTQEQWDDQGRNFDRAREEFEEEQRDNYSEQDWLENQGIRYASDVQNEYNDLTWPYWTSTSAGDAEADIKGVALDFMNSIGMDTVAVSDNYHGSYEKWNGSEWVSIGRNKPDDCFTIEPDGSLDGDNSSDAGLEFVSPPIPLEDIGTVMSKVQNWAGNYGAYTGLNNKTSMHTNISVPGYDLDKLDYVKAALLLGDEYVLREFERFGNTYAKPAIEKVRQLIRQKPDQAKELLDKMKSQLNAEASKLIHSGTTDKFTSINTKNNRIEYRSPGGDYLSDIADNPKKLMDTINRMVVTMDAAMDPEKYKQEYQKKLYKLLTGQESGREGATGAKKEMKADDKDLLNIFSRYAAGELPRQALKSFVRQAQLQRKVEKGEGVGKMWWSVSRPGYGARAEVVASSKDEAIAKGKQEYPDWADAQDMTAKPLRPYIEPEYKQPTGDAELDSIHRELGLQAPENSPTLNGRPSNPDGNYVIVDGANEQTPVYRYMAVNGNDALLVLRQWISANPGTQWNFKFDPNQLMGQPTTQQPAQQDQGNWGIWINANERFANQPGSYLRSETPPLMRFSSEAAAEQWIEQQRAERPNMRTDIEVREIEPAEPIPGSTLDLQRQRAAQQGVDTSVDYEIYNRETGEVLDTAQLRNDEEAMIRLDDYRQHGPHRLNYEEAERAFGIRRGPGVTNAQSNTNSLRPTGPGPWEVANRSNNQVYFNPPSTYRRNAESEARTWLAHNGHNEADFEIRTREGANSDTTQGGIIDIEPDISQYTAPQTLTRPGQGQQVFTGEWKVIVDGEEVYRFSGIGNNQGDANRVGRDWVLQQVRRGTLAPADGADVEVLPVMSGA